MKAKFLLLRSLCLFLILVAGLAVQSCSSDDDDGSGDIIVQTWLEKYDGTKWEAAEEDDFLYIRIVNNTNIISESWHRFRECFIYNVADKDDEFEIIENSPNRLVFEVVGDVFQRNTMTVSGNILTWVIEYEFWEEPATVTFEKTTVDVDGLPLCEK